MTLDQLTAANDLADRIRRLDGHIEEVQTDSIGLTKFRLAEGTTQQIRAAILADMTEQRVALAAKFTEI